MANKDVRSTLQEASQRLDEARDLLLKGSNDCLKADNPTERQLAERLFGLAKNADSLRRDTLSFMDALSGVAKKTKHDRIESVRDVQKPQKKRKEDYPMYSIRGDQLVKTGLSRDRKNEYEHTVPRAEFERIIEKLVRLRTVHEDFKSEDVHEGLDLPVYQTYAVLSLLRQLGIIKQGRRGYYSFESDNLLDASTFWNVVDGGTQ